jgi:hypothetical protein
MNLTNTTATFGLNSFAAPNNAATNGQVQVGPNIQTLRLTEVTKIHSFEVLLMGNGSELEIDVSDMDLGAGSTAWVAGTAQVETATAAGTVSAAGNLTITVTSAGMTGSPLAVSVPVLNGDTADVWAGKVRTALAANATIAERFTISGTSTAIVLTRKPLQTIEIAGESIPIQYDNDTTLNIATANGTAAGITEAATSANTTAGVETVGAYAPYLNERDVFGDDLALQEVAYLSVLNTSESLSVSVVEANGLIDCEFKENGGVCLFGSIIEDLTIGADGSPATATITIAGT